MALFLYKHKRTGKLSNLHWCIFNSIKTVNTAKVIQGTEIQSHNQGFHLLNGIYNTSILYDGYFKTLDLFTLYKVFDLVPGWQNNFLSTFYLGVF